jgi:hypothetical protein
MHMNERCLCFRVDEGLECGVKILMQGGKSKRHIRHVRGEEVETRSDGR